MVAASSLEIANEGRKTIRKVTRSLADQTGSRRLRDGEAGHRQISLTQTGHSFLWTGFMEIRSLPNLAFKAASTPLSRVAGDAVPSPDQPRPQVERTTLDQPTGTIVRSTLDAETGITLSQSPDPVILRLRAFAKAYLRDRKAG